MEETNSGAVYEKNIICFDYAISCFIILFPAYCNYPPPVNEEESITGYAINEGQFVIESVISSLYGVLPTKESVNGIYSFKTGDAIGDYIVSSDFEVSFGDSSSRNVTSDKELVVNGLAVKKNGEEKEIKLDYKASCQIDGSNTIVGGKTISAAATIDNVKVDEINNDFQPLVNLFTSKKYLMDCLVRSFITSNLEGREIVELVVDDTYVFNIDCSQSIFVVGSNGASGQIAFKIDDIDSKFHTLTFKPGNETDSYEICLDGWAELGESTIKETSNPAFRPINQSLTDNEATELLNYVILLYHDSMFRGYAANLNINTPPSAGNGATEEELAKFNKYKEEYEKIMAPYINGETFILGQEPGFEYKNFDSGFILADSYVTGRSVMNGMNVQFIFDVEWKGKEYKIDFELSSSGGSSLTARKININGENYKYLSFAIINIFNNLNNVSNFISLLDQLAYDDLADGNSHLNINTYGSAGSGPGSDKLTYTNKGTITLTSVTEKQKQIEASYTTDYAGSGSFSFDVKGTIDKERYFVNSPDQGRDKWYLNSIDNISVNSREIEESLISLFEIQEKSNYYCWYLKQYETR